MKNTINKEYAADILLEKLLKTGMTEIEIHHLLGKFLEEEAFDYVKAMNELGIDLDDISNKQYEA